MDLDTEVREVLVRYAPLEDNTNPWSTAPFRIAPSGGLVPSEARETLGRFIEERLHFWLVEYESVSLDELAEKMRRWGESLETAIVLATQMMALGQALQFWQIGKRRYPEPGKEDLVITSYNPYKTGIW